MGDDVKVVGQNTPPVIQDDQAQSQAQVQPIVPTGSLNKEAGPVMPTPEFIKSSEIEPQISQDLKELGIEAKKDAPNVTDKHKGIVEHAKEFTPVSSFPSGKIAMPMSEEEIEKQLKTGQDDDSSKGLAKLLDKIMRVLGL